jgi:hypothetical protein
MLRRIKNTVSLMRCSKDNHKIASAADDAVFPGIANFFHRAEAVRDIG